MLDEEINIMFLFLIWASSLVKPLAKARMSALKIINVMENVKEKAFLDSIKCTTWAFPFFLFFCHHVDWWNYLCVTHTYSHWIEIASKLFHGSQSSYVAFLPQEQDFQPIYFCNRTRVLAYRCSFSCWNKICKAFKTDPKV